MRLDRDALTSVLQPSFNIFFSFSKLLVVVLGPDSVEELLSVEPRLKKNTCKS